MKTWQKGDVLSFETLSKAHSQNRVMTSNADSESSESLVKTSSMRFAIDGVKTEAHCHSARDLFQPGQLLFARVSFDYSVS